MVAEQKVAGTERVRIWLQRFCVYATFVLVRGIAQRQPACGHFAQAEAARRGGIVFGSEDSEGVVAGEDISNA